MSNEAVKFGMESLHWYNPQNIGGVERYAKRLVGNLVENGYMVSVYTGPNFRDFSNGSVQTFTEEGVAMNYHMDVPSMIASLEEVTRSGGVDLVELEGFYGIRSDLSIMKRVLALPVPLVWVSHNAGILEKQHIFADQGYEFAKEFSGRIDAVICKSKPLADDAVTFGFGKEKVNVIYNAVDEKIFNPVSEQRKVELRNELGLPLDKKIVLYVGRVSTEKGSGFLMESWPEIMKTNPEYHLVICGDAAPNSALEAQYVEFKKVSIESGQASFSEGFVQDEKILAKYYQAADIFILPSPQEGLGNVLIEAMACEKPCIISKKAQETSGAGDLVIPGFNGTIFDEYTPVHLLKALKGVNDQMGRNGLAKYKLTGFGIEAVGKQHRSLYEKLVHGTPYSVAMVKI